MRLVHCPSPNHDARPDGVPVDILVLHYTGMETADAALARLCDPEAQVSAHYTIDRTGRIYAHVPEERRAWHAGLSYWAGERNINGRSIGIELVNPGHEFGYEPFPEPQILSLIGLAKEILSRHPIPPHRVLGHSDVAPARKIDPGELFPWARLAGEGVGLWPQVPPGLSQAGSSQDDPAELLARFGYGLAPEVDASLGVVLSAFQRHFRPSRIDGIADAETLVLLSALAGRA
ncbi:N-acetylmuramoyl-L-alanine amidase [Rhizomicrobium palustre]|uniref:N-acetylmuramoyl-L-alanine amidase n=1 Tax=Rhizomicrobium palustre TaxID=189966 RepID=A0A846MVK1_9PROT|nr:N-acetylmuramoyl-L-alanine amidase [Rhizomicrobium palustre]NIK87514.1 N-acetylmuramoyl-L-alanine amidase [Rhizomicrobium palustre]